MPDAGRCCDGCHEHGPTADRKAGPAREFGNGDRRAPLRQRDRPKATPGRGASQGGLEAAACEKDHIQAGFQKNESGHGLGLSEDGPSVRTNVTRPCPELVRLRDAVTRHDVQRRNPQNSQNKTGCLHGFREFCADRCGAFAAPNSWSMLRLGARHVAGFSATRTTRRGERRCDLQHHCSTSGIFNNVNFNAPNSNVSSAQFGRITSALDPRILQFGLKLLF